MKKEELLGQIADSDGNVRISSISSREEGEDIIALAKLLEHQGKITLMEYCMESQPLAVSLQTKLCD